MPGLDSDSLFDLKGRIEEISLLQKQQKDKQFLENFWPMDC